MGAGLQFARLRAGQLVAAQIGVVDGKPAVDGLLRLAEAEGDAAGAGRAVLVHAHVLGDVALQGIALGHHARVSVHHVLLVVIGGKLLAVEHVAGVVRIHVVHGHGRGGHHDGHFHAGYVQAVRLFFHAVLIGGDQRARAAEIHGGRVGHHGGAVRRGEGVIGGGVGRHAERNGEAERLARQPDPVGFVLRIAGGRSHGGHGRSVGGGLVVYGHGGHGGHFFLREGQGRQRQLPRQQQHARKTGKNSLERGAGTYFHEGVPPFAKG